MTKKNPNYNDKHKALYVLQNYWSDLKRVTDAREVLEIPVSRDDVLQAKPWDPTACVFALAAQHNGAEAALVTATTAYIKRGNEAVRYSLGRSAKKQIVVFDWTGECKSGAVRFIPPYPSRRLGSQAAGRAHGKDRKKPTWSGRRKKPQHVSAGLRPSLAALAKERRP